MAIVAVSPVANVDFVPESEKKKKDPTTFIVRPLKESEKTPILDEMFGSGGTANISATHLVGIFKKTFSGWKNFKDEKGEPVVFNTRNQDANIDRVPFDISVEAGQFVFSISQFTEEESKNSDGQ